ncbi:unnamed protein product [Rhodiola kirilowii]
MEDEQWCPEAAMKAYLSTLQLCKGDEGESRAVVAEPEYTEFISALAAGNGAQLIVEIASETTPLTLALAVAAKQTGGQFVCILPTHHQLQSCESHVSIRYPELKDAIKFMSGDDPCEIMTSFDRHVDFVVINDSEFEEHLRLLEVMMRKQPGINGRRSVVHVVERLGRSSKGTGRVVSFGEAVRGREGVVDSVSLPVSGGVELTRIKNKAAAGGTTCGKVGSGGGRRCRRFHVIVENR